MSKTVRDILVTIGIGIAVWLVGTILDGGFNYETVNEFLIQFGFYQLYSFVLGYSNKFFFDYLEKIDWGPGRVKPKRITIGIVGSVIITMIGLFLLRLFTATIIYGQSVELFLERDKLEYYRFGLWITLTIVIIFHFVYFYNRYQKSKIKEQKVIAGTASAKFDALKNQLDPHFLFNSLNVLTSLIEENPDNAQRFTTALSKVYRYVLEQKNKDLVTVDEELDFARTYMSLLKMRFEDSIIFDIPERASNPESKVVPLSLQLLLENAVKHNMVTSSKPLHIRVFESGEELIVDNNLQPKKIVKKSSGVGLDNIRQRYNLLTNRKVIINQQAERFAVALPMLTKQQTIMRPIQTKMNDNYVRARKRVDDLKEFYYSLLSYVIIIPFLIFIWYTFTPFTIQWFWFPMFGWGIGLCFHAYKVFVNDGVFGAGWERKKIEQYMKDEDSKKWN